MNFCFGPKFCENCFKGQKPKSWLFPKPERELEFIYLSRFLKDLWLFFLKTRVKKEANGWRITQNGFIVSEI